MATQRKQVTIYFTDDEYDQLTVDADRAKMDRTPFAKHVLLGRGKMKVKALPPDAAKEIERLTSQNEELQRQIDTYHAERTKSETLAGLSSTKPPQTIDEMVAEKFQKEQDRRDLEAYRKLQKDHETLQGQLTEKEAELGKFKKLDFIFPHLAQGLGSVLVNKFPDVAHGVATMANSLGAQLGALPAPAAAAGDDEISPEEEKMLELGRQIVTALQDPDALHELVLMVNTISAVPPMLPPLVAYARQILPQVVEQQQQQAQGVPG